MTDQALDLIKKEIKIDKIAQALSAAQGELKSIPKTGKNRFFKNPDNPEGSGYSELDIACDYAFPILHRHGLSISQVGRCRGDMLFLETILMHSPSGQEIVSEWPIAKINENPQKIGSATTYARRYAFMSIIGLTAHDEDDDGNGAISQDTPTHSILPKTPIIVPAKEPVKNYAPQSNPYPTSNKAPNELLSDLNDLANQKGLNEHQYKTALKRVIGRDVQDTELSEEELQRVIVYVNAIKSKK